MKQRKNIKLQIVSLLATACFIVITPALSQVPGATQLPPVKPRIDQLGQMHGVKREGKTLLAFGLFAQTAACVIVALALAAHLSSGRKT